MPEVDAAFARGFAAGFFEAFAAGFAAGRALALTAGFAAIFEPRFAVAFAALFARGFAAGFFEAFAVAFAASFFEAFAVAFAALFAGFAAALFAGFVATFLAGFAAAFAAGFALAFFEGFAALAFGALAGFLPAGFLAFAGFAFGLGAMMTPRFGPPRICSRPFDRTTVASVMARGQRAREPLPPRPCARMLRLVPGLALPLLEPHRSSLETCVFCPKLCRAACPVSNVEASETVTPWGKMSTAYFAARGDVPLDREHAATAWACTSCFACRDMCKHENPVATVLTEARAEAFSRGFAPPAATRVSDRWPERAREVAYAVDVVATQTDTDRAAATESALLFGCGYARRAPDVARDAVQAAVHLTGAKQRPVRACCGLPLLHAGDRDGFAAAARRFAAEVARAPEIVAVDPGCARALLVEYPRIGVRLPKVRLLLDLAAAKGSQLRALDPEELHDLATTARAATASEGATTARAATASEASASDARSTGAPEGPTLVRWHDPCQLGRGLGRYEEPRAVLERVTPGAAGFQRERDAGECSGGGGLLPVTRPETSREIARGRIAEHRAKGGGLLVTHCASSLHRFRTAGEAAIDLTSLVARALRPRGAR